MGFFDNIKNNNIKTMPVNSIREIEYLRDESLSFDDGDEISLSDKFVNNTIKDYVKSHMIVQIMQDAYNACPQDSIGNIRDIIEACIEKYNQSRKQSGLEEFRMSSYGIAVNYWDSLLLQNEASAWINTFIENKDNYLQNTPLTICDSEIDDMIKNNPPEVKTFKCLKTYPSCQKCVFNQLSKTASASGCICSKINCRRNLFKFE